MSLLLSPRLSTSPLPRVFAAILASGLLAAASAAPRVAQAAPEDDPYGIGTPSAIPMPPDSTRRTPPAPVPVPDTTRPATPRTGSVEADTLSRPAAPVATPDTTPTPRAPRTRITRETTVNPMDVHRGSYRNPKKALFMSLIVPGLGQAYIGQSKFNYIRAALYFTADVTMGYLWYDYSVVKYDKKVKQYRQFADQHWSQPAYEAKILELGDVTDQVTFEKFNPNRTGYCQSVQPNEGGGSSAYAGCLVPYSDKSDDQIKYSDFQGSFSGDNPATVGARRAGFPDDVAFYEMIGRNKEFLYGWGSSDGAGGWISDVAADPAFPSSVSNPGYNLTDTTWVGKSANRDAYNAMRQTAKDYSRMQTWFLGGIVLNHIASAVDAAITARRHNRILYEDGGARWFDKVNLDGGMAMDLGRPRTYMTAYLSF